ncbi:MAG: DUF6427 family protein [Tannerellaceae bacterium]|jgi:hypothetical protein|nr:DUF6427 family protein [Tannerellaceae bacterium]
MKARRTGYDRQYTVDSPINYTILLGASLLFWMIGYKTAADYPVQIGGDIAATPIYELIYLAMPGKAVACLIGILLTLAGAFLLHRANYLMIIIREKTVMPFLFYVLFISSNPGGYPLNTTTSGMFCLMLAFYRLLTSYNEIGAIRKAFNIGLFTGLASLLWVHALWFIPLLWWGMYSFKALTLRTLLSSIIGIAVNYWFLLGWCVIQHNFTIFSLIFAPLMEIGPASEITANLQPADWINITYIAFLSMIAIINILLHEHDDNLRTRRYLSFLIVFLIVSAGLLVLYNRHPYEFLNAACIPASILSAHFFTVQKGRKTLWLYYILTIPFIIISLLQSLWISSLNMVI